MSDFDQFYSGFWGPRWLKLKHALTEAEFQSPRPNAFSDFDFSKTTDFQGPIPRGPNGLLAIYPMDPGSIQAAEALQVQPGDHVLDLCAAPGGKSLILIEALKDSGDIILNDTSPGRRERLKKVIQQYVPRDIRNRVRITGKDGGVFSQTHANHFDRILVDAPCSGERHLLKSPKHQQEWNSKMSGKLALRQYALLSGALEAVKPGGRIVYSTCSLSNLENDLVIEKLLQKKFDRVRIGSVEAEIGEPTTFGRILLPDQALKAGPLYWCVLEKIIE